MKASASAQPVQLVSLSEALAVGENVCVVATDRGLPSFTADSCSAIASEIRPASR